VAQWLLEIFLPPYGPKKGSGVNNGVNKSTISEFVRGLYFGDPMILPAILSLVVIGLMLLGFWAVAN
jgi:hypothetical protein